MWASPAWRRPVTPRAVTSAPSTNTWPRVGRRRPAITSTSSAWPLPSTPATASTSPLRTEKLTPPSRSTPVASLATRSATTSRSAPAAPSSRAMGALTSRSTLMRASLARSVSAARARPATAPAGAGAGGPLGVDAVPVACRPDALGHGGRPQPAPGGVPAQHDVLGNRRRRHEHDVLVDPPDAGGERLARGVIGERPLLERDRAGVGPDEPEQHVHQGGLPRAVLAEEPEDGPRRDD